MYRLEVLKMPALQSRLVRPDQMHLLVSVRDRCERSARIDDAPHCQTGTEWGPYHHGAMIATHRRIDDVAIMRFDHPLHAFYPYIHIALVCTALRFANMLATRNQRKQEGALILSSRESGYGTRNFGRLKGALKR